MPSAFAHAAVGATLATVLPGPARPRHFVVLLAAAAAAPDLDVVFHQLGVAYDHPLGHRGFTHSVFFAVLLGAASVPAWRRAGATRAGLAGGLTTAAVLSHGLLDTFTDAGLGAGLFIPFDDGRYFAPFRPLMTSPLSIRAFFQGRGLAILANEATWIGPPTLLLAAIAAIV
ncbi:MAG: metal-dependent hydrolase, partial [Myxococcota bacterium]